MTTTEHSVTITIIDAVKYQYRAIITSKITIQHHNLISILLSKEIGHFAQVETFNKYRQLHLNITNQIENHSKVS